MISTRWSYAFHFIDDTIIWMKILLFPLVIFTSGLIFYLYAFSQKKKQKKINWVRVNMIVIVVLAVLALGLFGMYKAAIAPDTQCTTTHTTTSKPPLQLHSAIDYFIQGNYDFDIGNCKKALIDYTISVQLNPTYTQSYNNRAYTYMRMQNYKNALVDLNKALSLNPNYIHALMNRADIHNYYYAIDRKSAIVDYQKVILLNGTRGTSVCGHLLLAKHNGWNIGTILDFPKELNICN